MAGVSTSLVQQMSMGVGSCNHLSVAHKTASQNPTALRSTRFRLSHRPGPTQGADTQVKRDIQWLKKNGFSRTLWVLQLRKRFPICWRSYRCHHDSGSNKITFKDSWCLKSTWFRKKKANLKDTSPVEAISHRRTGSASLSLDQENIGAWWKKEAGGRKNKNWIIQKNIKIPATLGSDRKRHEFIRKKAVVKADKQRSILKMDWNK